MHGFLRACRSFLEANPYLPTPLRLAEPRAAIAHTGTAPFERCAEGNDRASEYMWIDY